RRGRQRLVLRHRGNVHEICCGRRGPAGHPVLGVSTLIITPVGEGRWGDAETEQGKQCRRGRLEEMSTRASREREANWTTGIHDALLSRMVVRENADGHAAMGEHGLVLAMFFHGSPCWMQRGVGAMPNINPL